eukprot:TRINITY_DN3511_c0_g1_i1.p1 TRINITY_DN3511_c0_g1~~TRINITY_DN3511_c0_g1_i1.p1  ORF type:complete len:373 (+),score=68.81 TRINITY_DN3511_c0_g1_i1:39-1157(+)
MCRLLFVLATALLVVGCQGSITHMGGEFFAFLDKMEMESQSTSAVVALNAHPNFFKKCERCFELHTYYNAFAPVAHSAAVRSKRKVQFIAVEYSQATEKLVREMNFTVPSVFILKGGSKQPIKFRAIKEQGGFSEDADLSPKEQRALRRKKAVLTHEEIDHMIGTAGQTLNEKSLAEWLKAETGVAVDVSLIVIKKDKPAKEEGVSINQILILAAAVISGCLFVWRIFTREVANDDEDDVQNLVRSQGWTVLLVGHVLVMGGLHWCILNDAAPMGAGGALFMSGRMRGQYLFEGLFVAGVIFAGAYAALAFHRAKALTSSPSGPRDVIKFALTVFGFMHLLMVMNILHKNYWYLSDTYFRKYMLTFVTSAKR